MKKTIIFIFLVVTFLIGTSMIIKAGTSHGVIGHIDNSSDGVDANNASVNFSIFNSSGVCYCNLTDIVGPDGNSGLSNWYAQDVGNCPVEWHAGDVVNISIVKDAYRNASTAVTLTANGSDQAPSIQLGSSPLPIATAYLPSQGTTSLENLVTFQLKCSDSQGVSTLRLYGNFTGTWELNITNSSPVNDVYWSTDIELPNGFYMWAAWCNDTDGNDDWSQNVTFSVNKGTPPQEKGGGGGGGGGGINNTCGDTMCNKISGEFNFLCYAWHKDYAIENLSLYGNWLGGWHNSQTAQFYLGEPGENASTNFTEVLYAGVYDWNCYACTVDECFFVSDTNYTLNATVQGSESWLNCCTDCGCLDGAICANNTCEKIATCGDGFGTCDPGESQTNCCADCGCPTDLVCSIEGCISPDEPNSCGDNLCDTATENIFNCPQDCIGRNAGNTTGASNGTGIVVGFCGDKVCGYGENQANCCKDCGCQKGSSCVKNKCGKTTFFWWVQGILYGFPWWILIFVIILVAAYLIIRNRINKTSLMMIILNIGKEIDKKKFNETQKKSKGKKIDYEKQNKKIEQYLRRGLKISKRILKEVIESGQVNSIQKLLEEKKQILHEIALGFEDYVKIVRKERISFEENLNDVFLLEEIPKYEYIKKQVYSLYDNSKKIKQALTSTNIKGAEENKQP